MPSAPGTWQNVSTWLTGSDSCWEIQGLPKCSSHYVSKAIPGTIVTHTVLRWAPLWNSHQGCETVLWLGRGQFCGQIISGLAMAPWRSQGCPLPQLCHPDLAPSPGRHVLGTSGLRPLGLQQTSMSLTLESIGLALSTMFLLAVCLQPSYWDSLSFNFLTCRKGDNSRLLSMLNEALDAKHSLQCPVHVLHLMYVSFYCKERSVTLQVQLGHVTLASMKEVPSRAWGQRVSPRSLLAPSLDASLPVHAGEKAAATCKAYLWIGEAGTLPRGLGVAWVPCCPAPVAAPGLSLCRSRPRDGTGPSITMGFETRTF